MKLEGLLNRIPLEIILAMFDTIQELASTNNHVCR